MGVGRSLLGVSFAIALSFAGCGGSDDSDGGGGGGSGGSTVTGECKPTADICYIAGADGPGNACMAKADFSTADVTELRMSSHQVVSPVALAQPFVQDSIITKKSALYEPDCNLDGLGQFNYLMTIDTAKKEVTLGGGVPQTLVGAPKDGTCWADYPDPVSSTPFKPVTQAYTESDGELTATFPYFVMPIYLEDKAEDDSFVLVPLHDMKFTAKLSADKNCIGSYAADKLLKKFGCQPGEGEFAWNPGGTYEGYITVEEADKVMVVSLGYTLCVVLTGDIAKWKGTANNCATSKGFTSEGGLPKGDYCSGTKSDGGCEDSWKLVIDFAAQAIDVKGTYDKASGGC